MKPKNLIAEYRRIANMGGNFRGLTVLEHRDQIRDLVAEYDVKSILDFGSGAGDQYREPHEVHRYWRLPRKAIVMYDPAFPHTSEKPKDVFDMVISSDVLEHVHEEKVFEAIDYMFAHARKLVWASVCCRPAKKRFEDGTNMHITLHPFEWWQDVFFAAASRHSENAPLPFVLKETP